MENVLAKLGAQVDREKVANESSSQSKVSNRVVRIRGVTLQGEHVTDATLDQMRGFTFESLMLNQTSVTDEGLAKLKHLPNLKRLFLGTMHIAGPGLAYLQDIPSLRYLELHSAPITDDLLAHLESMKNLEGVSLEMREKITDAGLTHLNGLTKLRKLNLYGTQVSDEGLKLLGRLTNLEELNLSHTRVTDAGLAHLNTFHHLKSLSLIRHFNGTRISDDGLSHLTDLKILERLELHGTQVTDRGMKHLAGLKNLRHVGLGLTGVSGNGLAELKELPNLQSLSLSWHQAYSGQRHLKQMRNLSRLTLYGYSPVLHDDPFLQEIYEGLPDCSIGFFN